MNKNDIKIIKQALIILNGKKTVAADKVTLAISFLKKLLK